MDVGLIRMVLYGIAPALWLSTVFVASFADDSKKLTPFPTPLAKPQRFYPMYENIIRKYVPGQPILGPGSALEDAITDRLHRPYRAKYAMPDTKKLLSDAYHKSSTEKDKLIDSMIKIYPGKKGASALSPKFVSLIKSGLAAYKRSFICLIAQNDCEVHLAPIVSDAEPHLAGVHPAGYDEYATWDNAGAVCTRGKSITIAEYRYWHNKLIPVYDCEFIARHEAAHAIDRCLGYPSLSTEFVEAYEIDRKNMSAGMREVNAYLMQEGERGLKEVFAEMLAAKYSDPQGKRWILTSTAFPHCQAVIEQIGPLAVE